MSKRDKTLRIVASGKISPISMQTLCGLLACCLTACSGSSNPMQGGADESEGPSSPDSVVSPQETAAVHGILLIKESNGKQVFHAFFTDQPRNDESYVWLWNDADRACYAAQNISGAGAADGRTPVNHSTLLAGSSIDFHDRGGKFLSLEPQSLGNTVVYASDVRWIDAELPQGTQLSVSGSDWFPETVAIELLPLQQIERLEPENGILSLERATVRWESGDLLTDEIEVVLTAPYEHSAIDNMAMIRVTRVYCVLPDNGSFDLPDSVRSAMGNPDRLHVSVSRRRSSELTYEGSVLSVLQISND